MAKKCRVINGKDKQLALSNEQKTMVYKKGRAVFAFNFHPTNSYEGFFLPLEEEGAYKVTLTTDDAAFGGHDRVSTSYVYHTEKDEQGRNGIRIYIPSRCAVVLKKR